MSNKRIALIIVLAALVATALLFRQPIETWAATQSCIWQVRDHYSNVEELQGAPDFATYMESGRV